LPIQLYDKAEKFKALPKENRILLFFTIVVFFGGALRKWFIPVGVVGNLVLMLQLLLPFLLVAFRSKDTISPFAKYPTLTIYFGYLLFHVVYPLQVTIFHGILGVFIYGIFWIAIFYYISNRHVFRADRLIPYMIIFSALEFVLGFIQYTLPSTHFLNKYAHEGVSSVAVIADSVRITGTFSYISGFTAFLLSYPLLLWAMIRLNFSTWLISIGITFGLIGAFMSGSRGAVLIYLAYTGIIIISLYRLSDIGKIAGRLIIPIAIGLSIILAIGNNPLAEKIEKSYTNFIDRFERGRTSGEQSRRLTGDLSYFQDLSRFPNIITGIGLGSTYQGAIILFGVSPYARAFGYVEGELVKIILEGGIVYYFLRIILATILVLNLSFNHRILRLLIWFSLVYGIPIVFNVHNASFFLIGLILVDNIEWRLQQRVKPKMKAAEMPEILLDKQIPGQVNSFPGYPQVNV
jgi:hypothetical protein